MKQIILFLIFFILVYLFYLFFVILKPKQIDKYHKSTEVLYLQKKYNINIENIKKIAHLNAISNAFIISFTLSIVSFIDNIILKFLIGFITLIGLIIIIYHILGISLYKKQNRKK